MIFLVFCLYYYLKDSGKVFIGDRAVWLAKQIVDPNHCFFESDPRSDLVKSWEVGKIRVFISHKFKKKLPVEEGSLVLIEVSYIDLCSMIY